MAVAPSWFPKVHFQRTWIEGLLFPIHGARAARNGSIRCGPTVEARSMAYDFTNAKYWFNRAEAVRARAAAMKDPINKATLLRIAEDYEDLGLSAQLVVGKPPSTQKRILMEAKS